MKISVVVLTYCHEKFVVEALESILMQEVNAELEIIVADDASRDNTAAVVKEYVEKHSDNERVSFKLLFHEQNVGAKKNMYLAFSQCEGTYIAYLEGDDYWTDVHKLQKQLDYLEAHEDCSMVTHYISRSDEQGNVIEASYDRFKPEKNLLTFDDIGKVVGHASSILCRNYGSELIAYLKQLTAEKYCPGDTAVPLFFYSKGYIYVIQEVMSNYRFVYKEGGTNWSSKHHYYRDFLFFYMAAVRHEKLAKQFGAKLDLIGEKANYYNGARKAMIEYKSKKQLLSCIAMFILTPQRLKLLKLAKEKRDKN